MPSPCGVGVPWHPDGPQSVLDDLRVVAQAKAPTEKLDLKLVDDDDAGVLDGLESEEAEVQEEENESALSGQGDAPEEAFEPGVCRFGGSRYCSYEKDFERSPTYTEGNCFTFNKFTYLT